jgi:hypothetical protein
MARRGPRGGGKFTASIRLRVDGHGLVSDTLGAMDKEIEFDRAGASFRRRRKRASTDQNLPSFMPTSATSVVEATTLTRLVSSAISSRVLCAPTPRRFLLHRSSRLASVEGSCLQERTHLGLHESFHQERLQERLHERLQERLSFSNKSRRHRRVPS